MVIAPRVPPNPSLKRRANGKPPGPGRWYAVHFRRPEPGVLPSLACFARTLGRTGKSFPCLLPSF